MNAPSVLVAFIFFSSFDTSFRLIKITVTYVHKLSPVPQSHTRIHLARLRPLQSCPSSLRPPSSHSVRSPLTFSSSLLKGCTWPVKTCAEIKTTSYVKMTKTGWYSSGLFEICFHRKILDQNLWNIGLNYNHHSIKSPSPLALLWHHWSWSASWFFSKCWVSRGLVMTQYSIIGFSSFLLQLQWLPLGPRSPDECSELLWVLALLSVWVGRPHLMTPRLLWAEGLWWRALWGLVH